MWRSLERVVESSALCCGGLGCDNQKANMHTVFYELKNRDKVTHPGACKSSYMGFCGIPSIRHCRKQQRISECMFVFKDIWLEKKDRVGVRNYK